MKRRPPRSNRTEPLFPYTTLFRSIHPSAGGQHSHGCRPSSFPYLLCDPQVVGAKESDEIGIAPAAGQKRLRDGRNAIGLYHSDAGRVAKRRWEDVRTAGDVLVELLVIEDVVETESDMLCAHEVGNVSHVAQVCFGRIVVVAEFLR